MHEDLIEWESTPKNAILTIKDQYFHHHAREIITSHMTIHDFIIGALNANISISPRIKSNKKVKSKAIKAADLNKSIRNLLSKNESKIDVKFEVTEDNGVFYFADTKNPIGGFDFAILNNEKNLLSLRNLCFGKLQYYDAEKRWDKFLKKNPELIGMGKSIRDLKLEGQNIDNLTTSTPLIVGEIQFGNWALAYRDFFKVLKADVQNNIDCLLYIVPCDQLEASLSNGIVTYDKTVKIIKEFEKVINVPVWVIGLNIEYN